MINRRKGDETPASSSEKVGKTMKGAQEQHMCLKHYYVKRLSRKQGYVPEAFS